MRGYVGTNYGHGASAALLSEHGELLFAVEEGKLIGQKDTSQFPNASLDMIIQYPGIEIVGWAEGWNAWRRLLHKGLLRTARYAFRDSSYFEASLRKEWGRYRCGERMSAPWQRRFGQRSFIGHHLAHAWSLVPAGLPAKSLVLVSDTTGESESISTYVFTGQRMLHLASSAFPHSLGSVFHQMAYHFGFGGRTGPGKLMALSAFGEPRYLSDLKSIACINNGVVKIDLKKFPAWRRGGSWMDFAQTQTEECCAAIRSAYCTPDGGHDLAASMQAWFTDTTWELILQSKRLAEEKYDVALNHIGLVGGAALNCQANGIFLRRMDKIGLKSLTVSPWSDDAGTAIGATACAFAADGNDVASISRSNAFLGPSAVSSTSRVVGELDIIEAVEAIVNGGIIALVSGRLEFGPRALGGRCLLADPRRKGARDQLNRTKGRPQFMPVAPAVLATNFNDYFEGIGSPHMAWTVLAKNKACSDIPAAVHCNGTARVQVVDDYATPLLAKVVKEFSRMTGHPVLLLTSLNGAGEAVPARLTKASEISERLEVVGILTDEGWVRNSKMPRLSGKPDAQ